MLKQSKTHWHILKKMQHLGWVNRLMKKQRLFFNFLLSKLFSHSCDLQNLETLDWTHKAQSGVLIQSEPLIQIKHFPAAGIILTLMCHQ